MSDERASDLSAEERSEFEAISGPVTPPAECEDRIVAALREHDLIRSEVSTRSDVVVPFPQRLLRTVPRISMAAAALVMAFFLGSQYGRGPAPVDRLAAVEPGDPPAATEGHGDLVKDERGEVVMAPRPAAQGYRPDPALLLAAVAKPSMGSADLGAFDRFSLDDDDGSFSLRNASR